MNIDYLAEAVHPGQISRLRKGLCDVPIAEANS
jgi:hypothetical protein